MLTLMVEASRNAAREIQNLLFPADELGELKPVPRRYHVPQKLTPEQLKERRERRKKLLDWWRRHQRLLVPDAFPPKPRKKKRRRIKSHHRHRLNRRPKKPLDPNRVLKRQPKPLASPLYNLPAALVDEIVKIDLSKRKHVNLAHAIADQLAREDEEIAEEIEKIHRLIEELAEKSPDVEEEIESLKVEWESRKEEVQKNWSDNHEHKANNYPIEPMVFERLSIEGMEIKGREVFE